MSGNVSSLENFIFLSVIYQDVLMYGFREFIDFQNDSFYQMDLIDEIKFGIGNF